MFEQSFTLSVTTDAEGNFHSAQPVTSPFALDVKIRATLQSPEGATIYSTFTLSPSEGPTAEPLAFTGTTGQTVNLGKWSVVAGDDANVATATGHTEPPMPETELTVEFIAEPSFF
jgi:hypothetical protein